MNSIKTIAFTASFALLAVSAAQGEKWTFSVKGGVVNAIGGDVHRGPNFDGSVLLDLEPGSLPVDVDAKSFDDVYGTFNQIGIEAAFRFSPGSSWFFGLAQMESDDGFLRVGTVGDSLPLNGRFSDYEDIELYGGYRHHFVNESAWQPFVSAQIGVKDVDDITASFSVPDVTFVAPFQGALTNAAFYDGGTVFSYGIGFGLDYRVSESATVSIESGFYSQEAIDDNDSVLDVLGLGVLNDEGDLDYMPLTLRFNFLF